MKNEWITIETQNIYDFLFSIILLFAFFCSLNPHFSLFFQKNATDDARFLCILRKTRENNKNIKNEDISFVIFIISIVSIV